ncbi:MAG: HEAT repeat domain-containing protein [Candidatus Saccharibacteria bacterium]
MTDVTLELLESLLVPESRMDALCLLEQLARENKVDGRVVTYLIPILHAPEPEVRVRASWLMGKLAQNKVDTIWPVEELNNLLHDDEPEVRENAAWTIGELTSKRVGTVGSIEHLNRLLVDETPSVRGMAAWAIGRLAERLGLGFSSSVVPLKELSGDRFESVRRSATYALEHLAAIGIAE